MAEWSMAAHSKCAKRAKPASGVRIPFSPLQASESWLFAYRKGFGASRESIIPLHPQGTGGDPPDTPCVATLLNAPNVRSWNSEALVGWTSSSEILSPDEIREEQIMLGLRTAEGVPGYGRIPEDRWFVADSIIAGLI